MVTSKRKRKRSKAVIITLLPALIFMFLIGWCMYWIGNRERRGKIQHKPPKKDGVTIMPIVFEAPQEILNE